MRAESDGRATFLVHPESGATSPAAPDLSSEPAIAGTLARRAAADQRLRRAPQGFCRAWRAASWYPITRAAQRLAEAHPDCYFLLPDGVSYHGHAVSGGRKTSGGPLALKRELRELTAQVEVREREADELTAELEDLERGLAQLAEELEHVRALAAGAGKGRAGAGSRAAQAGRGIRPRRLAAFRGAPGAGAAGARRRASPRAARAESGAGGGEGASALRSGKSSGDRARRVRADCRRMRTRSAKNTRRCAPSSPGSKSAPARRRPPRRGSKPRSGSWRRAARNWRASWNAWAWNARGCWPTISSWISAPQQLLGAHRRGRRAGRDC